MKHLMLRSLPHFLFFMACAYMIEGCTAVPLSFKEQTLSDMYLILTPSQYDSLATLKTDEEIHRFLETYWNEMDSSNGTGDEIFKNEFLKRVQYANDHYPDVRGWGHSDRKRIYVQYGPPADIEYYQSTDIPLGSLTIITSFEIWSYNAPGNLNSFPSYEDSYLKGMKKFIFCDITGTGVYQLLYSTEDGGDIDLRLLVRGLYFKSTL